MGQNDKWMGQNDKWMRQNDKWTGQKTGQNDNEIASDVKNHKFHKTVPKTGSKVQNNTLPPQTCSVHDRIS